MHYLTTLILSSICAVGCYKLAEDKNRNTTMAAVLGFIFNIFSVIGYAVLKNKKTQIS